MKIINWKNLLERWTSPDCRIPNHRTKQGHLADRRWLRDRPSSYLYGKEYYTESASKQRGQFSRLKHCIDFLLAVVFCIILLPLIVVIWVAIRLDSPGKAIYCKTRLGKEGRLFKIYKFRSMYLDADKRLWAVLKGNPELRRQYELFHKIPEDPRVTGVGRILRRFSLDEIPQLLNVLKGDMNIVGPRPYDLYELPKMKGAECIIQCVKPGITGLWQVSGRNNLTFTERIALECDYACNWSIWSDFKILARTVPVLLSGDGAY